MPRASRKTARANREAYDLGYRGARGGQAGAAAAFKRAHRSRRAAAYARRSEALYAEGLGANAPAGWGAWRRITNDSGPDHTYYANTPGNYSEMLARAVEFQGGDLADAYRRLGRWDSEFSRLYRAALADNFRHLKRGPYHRLLVYLGWRRSGKEIPRWAAGNTPAPVYEGYESPEAMDAETAYRLESDV